MKCGVLWWWELARPADTDMSCLRCAHASLVRHFTPDFPSSINKHLFIFLDYICGHSVDGTLPCRLGAFRLTQVWYVLNSLPARKRHETGVAISPLLLDVSSETVIRISYNVRLVETTCWSLPGREIERARKRQFSADWRRIVPNFHGRVLSAVCKFTSLHRHGSKSSFPEI